MNWAQNRELLDPLNICIKYMKVLMDMKCNLLNWAYAQSIFNNTILLIAHSIAQAIGEQYRLSL